MSRVVLVTGASRGIGRETARLFAERGDKVVIHYHRSREAAISLCEDLKKRGKKAMAIGGDVSSRRDMEFLFVEVERELGPAEVLINNAGIAGQALFTDLTREDWDSMFAVHVGGAFHCSQLALPHMIQKKRGAIVNISSIWGITGASCEVHYSAAKAALIGMTKALAKEVGPSGIRVNCVAPGVVQTDMLDGFTGEDLAGLKEETPLGTLGTPRDIAEAVYYLASPEAGFITGQVLSPNGGFVI